MTQGIEQWRDFTLRGDIRRQQRIAKKLQPRFRSSSGLPDSRETEGLRRSGDLVYGKDQIGHPLRRVFTMRDLLPQHINAGDATRQVGAEFSTDLGHHLPEFVITHEATAR